MPLIYASTRPPTLPDPRLSNGLIARWLAPLISNHKRRRIEQVIRQRLISVTVVLENLHDPHNGAAAMRSCEAMGLHHIHVVQGHDSFSFSRKVSQNAHKWLNVMKHRSIDDCVAYLHEAGFRCWAASPPPLDRGTDMETSVAIDGPVALMLGNEHSGLSPRAIELCDEHFVIPLQGFTESLNLSVAVAVSVHDVTSRRRAALGRAGDLDNRSLDQLRAAFYAMSTPHASSVVHRRIGELGDIVSI